MARWQRSNSCGRLYSRNHRYRHGFCDLPGLAERHPKGDRQRLVRDNGFSTWQRNGLDRAIAAVGYVFFDRRRILFRSEAPALAETALGGCRSWIRHHCLRCNELRSCAIIRCNPWPEADTDRQFGAIPSDASFWSDYRRDMGVDRKEPHARSPLRRPNPITCHSAILDLQSIRTS